MLSNSPAAVQPHIPATQPGPVVLVLVRREVLDDGRLPGLERVGILVRAVPGTQVRGAGVFGMDAFQCQEPSGSTDEQNWSAMPGFETA